MTNPYDPAQSDAQQWGQPSNPNRHDQAYGGQAAPAPAQRAQQSNPPQSNQGNQQWSGGGQQWQPQATPPPPAEPAQINWASGAPDASRAPWQGPAAFAPPALLQVPATRQPAPVAPPAAERPWVVAGTAQTAQEVAGRWESSQFAAPSAEPQTYQPPAPEPRSYQPPAREPQAYQPAPPEQSAQEQWPSYNNAPSGAGSGVATAPSSGAPINEAATVTTPVVAEPPAEAQAEPEALTIGRGRGNSIVLDDMLVSRQHVRITADSEGLVLEDLGSRNGTYVNGRRVERTHLSEGDRIGIGAATFEVRDGWLLNV